MTTSPRVFVVIPVHDRIQYTLPCLESLAKQTRPDVTVIVVDGGSTDGTSDIVARDHPEVTLLAGDGTLWWAGATNRGVEWALTQARDDDFVLTMNNDTVVSPSYVDSLLSAAEMYPHALIGSLAVDAADATKVLDWGVRINWWIGGGIREAPPSPPFVDSGTPDCRSVDVLPGRGTLIPTAAFRTIGLFDQARLPHYGADYEFARRAHRAGYDVLVNRASIVRSHPEATGINPGRQRLGIRKFVESYTSLRSDRCLLYRWRFARLCLPAPQAHVYFAASTARSLVSGVRDQLRLHGESAERR